MSYEQKIAEAERVLGSHYAQVGDGDGLAKIATFIETLKTNGGTSDEGLRACSFEDLESFGLPRLLARNIANMFRKEEKSESARPAYVSAKQAARMTDKELLVAYDPRESDNEVGQRLKKISYGKRMILFNDDDSVNVEVSLMLLQDVREISEEHEIFTVNGRPRPTYRVGERPEQLADENPLYPGRVLGSTGTCDQLNRSWSGVSNTVRVLLHLAVRETGEASIRTLDEAHQKMDLAILPDAEATIRTRYPKASVRYDELERVGKLPSLKVRRGGRNGERQNDPFAATSPANRRF